MCSHLSLMWSKNSLLVPTASILKLHIPLVNCQFQTFYMECNMWYHFPCHFLVLQSLSFFTELSLMLFSCFSLNSESPFSTFLTAKLAHQNRNQNLNTHSCLHQSKNIQSIIGNCINWSRFHDILGKTYLNYIRHNWIFKKHYNDKKHVSENKNFSIKSIQIAFYSILESHISTTKLWAPIRIANMFNKILMVCNW